MDESGHPCERPRFWTSLRLDGELSELEGALLDAHLLRCAGCRAVAESFGASTAALRSASLKRVAPVTADLSRASCLPAAFAASVLVPG
ncbi:MAG: zf-HC2 domain-containing protein [Gaiellaceae bacterium]